MKPVPALASLQARFADAVLDGGDERLAPLLAGDPGVNRRRLAVYRDAVHANRRETLRGAFPVVARLVGEGFFDEATKGFGWRSPPACADLNRYGEGFPAFLAAYPHAAAMPWLADVARLEWAWQESLMAADEPVLDYAALTGIADAEPEGLRLRLHASVRLVRSAWPVLAIWEANQPDRDGTPAREEGTDDVLAWREAQRVRLALLSPPEADFLEGLGRGLPLGEVCAKMDGRDFTGMLVRLARHGMLGGYSVEGAAKA
ncbi:MAG: putative DNA-binding domain-containing protein [Betaproteobacteria bacterium]|nr:putative DNA-binding domain-containing protein [Betaproteobacteria bacterium]